MATPMPLPPDIAIVAAPPLLGYLFNWGLYGALFIQVYIYYLAFPNDKKAVKTLVLGLFLVETFQTVVVANDAFRQYAKGFGDIIALGTPDLECINVPVLSGIVSFGVQAFFSYRIWTLSRSKILCAGILLIALAQASSAIVQGAQCFVINDYSKLGQEAFATEIIWLIGSAVCDGLIAICMCYFLTRSNTGFRTTQILIKRLVRLTVETGTLTASVATAQIIVFLAFPNTGYFITLGTVLAKLYSNTLLVILNSRIRIKGGRDESESTELAELTTTVTSSLSFTKASSNFRGRLPTLRRSGGDEYPPPNVIAIHKSVVSDRRFDGADAFEMKHDEETGAHTTDADVLDISVV